MVAVTLLGLAKPVIAGEPSGFSRFQVIFELRVLPLAIVGNVTPVGGIVRFASAGSWAGAAPT